MFKKSEGIESVDLPGLYEILNAGLEKVSSLRRTKPDRIMINSLALAVESMKESVDKGISIKEALKAASIAAEKGVEATKNIVARNEHPRLDTDLQHFA